MLVLLLVLGKRRGESPGVFDDRDCFWGLDRCLILDFQCLMMCEGLVGKGNAHRI